MSAVETAHAEAVAQHRAGRLAEAEVLYREALALDPSHAHSLALLGLLAHQTGRLALAEASLQQAISLCPEVAGYHCSLANALVAQGRLAEAVAGFTRALVLDPQHLETWNNLGSTLKAQGRLAEAAACFRRALALRPEFPELHFNLANVLAALGQVEPAIASFGEALQRRPAYPEAHNNLGLAYAGLGQAEAAAACYHKALAARPDYADALTNLGNTLRLQGQLDQAADCHHRAIACRPQHPDTYVNLANVLHEQRKFAAAEACCRQALRISPDLVAAHNNLALVLLAQGKFAEGWQEHEWRSQMTKVLGERRSFAQPQWRGEPAAGRTLLLHAEQGFGDTLQFCRYATLAAARGLRVVMEVQPPLVRLLRGLDGVAQVLARGEALPPFDLHCPMMSMPLAFGTTPETIPASAAYLHADADSATQWAERVARLPAPGLRVGLVWASGLRSHNAELAAIYRRKSLDHPDRMRPVLATPGVSFFSLQKDGPEAPADLPLHGFMHEMADFADTAALACNLDLVISVDTAVAHLAGALGVPVWLLAPFDACWRWPDGRIDNPWYPSLRVYRQRRAGDWDPVIAEVTRDLQRLAQPQLNGRAA
jgi:tetratricopeptide (TPR) repeat protein